MSEIKKLFEATKPFRDEIAKLQAEVEDYKNTEATLMAKLFTTEETLKAAELQSSEIQSAAEGLMVKVEINVKGYESPIISEHTRARNLGQRDILVWLLKKLEGKHTTNEKRKPVFIFCSGCGSQQKDCKCT